MPHLGGIFSLGATGQPAAPLTAAASAVGDQFSHIFHRQFTRAETILLCTLLALPPVIHYLRRMAHDPAARPPATGSAAPSGSRKQVVVTPQQETYGMKLLLASISTTV